MTACCPGASRAARPITSIDTQDAPRRTSGVGEFDRVLGGGIVPGAAILLSGEPGVGKSTLLLEVAAQSARAGRRVLYASAERSEEHTSELQSLMRISYAVFCLKQKTK